MYARGRRGRATGVRHGMLLLVVLLAACAAIRGRDGVPSEPVILVSLDAFRPVDLGRGLTPTLDRLLAEGAHATSMRPSFPTLTFPNHYTLVTGLRPDRNGVIHNTMTDPDLPGERFATSNRAAVQDARWWAQAEPIWTRVQRSGRRAATMYWPGSEAPVHGAYPDDWAAFDPVVTISASASSIRSSRYVTCPGTTVAMPWSETITRLTRSSRPRAARPATRRASAASTRRTAAAASGESGPS